MSDERNSRESNKPKNFYSVNLTPTRTIIIFVSAIAVLGLILVGSIIVFSTLTKNKNNTTQLETTKLLNNDYSYNYDLTGETTPVTTPILDTTGDKTNVNTLDNKVVTTNTTDKPITDTTDTLVDNSKTLYSSEFNKDQETTKSDNTVSKFKPVKEDTNKQQKNNSVATSKKTNQSTTKNNVVKDNNQKNTPKVTKNTNSPSKKYVVQIGSFSNKKMAEEISDFYQKNGNYPTYIRETIANGKTFYRLRVGPFTDKTNADKFLANLKESKYGKDSYISVVTVL